MTTHPAERTLGLPLSADRPRVFLDSSVVKAYLEGVPPSARILDPKVLAAFRLAVNPIVIQEALSVAEALGQGGLLADLQSQVQILPVDLKRAESLLPSARELRDRLIHSNDILMLSSAMDCDILLTYDLTVGLVAGGELQVLTPEEFFRSNRL
jgi:predicted nucleic acid-binding protein